MGAGPAFGSTRQFDLKNIISTQGLELFHKPV
jgi:hypothetical protein